MRLMVWCFLVLSILNNACDRIGREAVQESTVTKEVVVELPENSWISTWGGDLYDLPSSLEIDSLGNVYLSCKLDSEGPEEIELDSIMESISQDRSSSIVNKLDPDCELLWSISIGLNASDLATDSSGHLYISGQFADTIDADPSSDVRELTSKGNYDSIVCKLDPSSAFQWSHVRGESGFDHILCMAIDDEDHVYVNGVFTALETVDESIEDSEESVEPEPVKYNFFSKISCNGEEQWTLAEKQVGIFSVIKGGDMVCDKSGKIYLGGTFLGAPDFDPSMESNTIFTNTWLWNSDTFLSSLNGDGGYKWTYTFGGEQDDGFGGLAIDSSGNLFYTGWFQETGDFDPSPWVDEITSRGGADIFLIKFDHDMNYQWAKSWGGEDDIRVNCMTNDEAGSIYIAGAFTGTIMQGFNVENATTSNDLSDAYLCKINTDGELQWVKTWGGEGWDAATQIGVDAAGCIYVAGIFSATVDFDPGPSEISSASNGYFDIFLVKFLPDGTL